MNIKHIIITLAVLTGASSWGASQEFKKKRKRSNRTSSGIPASKRPCSRLENQDLEPSVLAGTTALDADGPAHLPLEMKAYIAQFVDQRTLQRFAQAGAGGVGTASEFTEIACRENAARAARFLKKHNGNGQKALLAAAKHNYSWATDYLIKYSVDINARDNCGDTALIAAAFYGHKVVVAQLIAAGADVNVVNKSGQTSLMGAALYGHEAIVAQLIVAGADVNVRDRIGLTALIEAALNGHGAIVVQLIAARADVNAKNIYGQTALMLAIRYSRGVILRTIGNCYEATAKLLIGAGADISILDDEQKKRLEKWIGG